MRSRQTGRSLTALLLALLALAFAGAPALGQAARRPSAYEDQDASKLTQFLGQMGMSEILEEMVSGGAGTAGDSGKRALAEAKIARVNGGNVTPADREKLLAEAEDLLAQSFANAKPATTEATIAVLKAKLRLAEVKALVHGEWHSLKIIYLQASPEDFTKLAALTEDSVKLIDQVLSGTETALRAVRNNSADMVNYLPDLEDLKSSAIYKGAWVRYYRAISLGPDKADEKARLLADCERNVETFITEEGEDNGVKDWCRLLMGRCHREGKELDEAVKFLKAAIDSPNAVGQIKLQAHFEMSRALVEQKKTDAALAAIAAYSKAATELKAESAVATDVKIALLNSYLYELLSADEKDPAKLATYAQETQKALQAFSDKYAKQPDVIQQFWEVIGSRTSDNADPIKLPSMALLSKAIMDIGKKTKPSLAKADELLDIISKRDDANSVSLKPAVLWQKAVLRVVRGDLVGAADCFAEIANKYPKDAKAFTAILTACKAYNQYVTEEQAGGRMPPLDVRQRFIAAMEAMLSNPEVAKQPELLTWHFDLGWQCQQMIALAAKDEDKDVYRTKAITMYEKVPADMKQNMDARRLALAFRVQQVLAIKDDGKRKTEGAKLLDMLRKYASDAELGAQKLTGDDQSNLRNWGAQAEFDSAQVMIEATGDQSGALALLETLPDKWKGTNILEDITEYRIRKIVERAGTSGSEKDIADAIKLVDEFNQKSPQRAPYLVNMIVRQIREQIEKLRSQPSQEKVLAQYRKAYHDFAQILYDQVSKDAKAPADRKLAFTRMVAEAHIENSQFQEALDFMKPVLEAEEQAIVARKKELDEQFDAKVKAAEAAKGDFNALKQQIKALQELLKANGIREENFAYMDIIASALKYAESADNSIDQTKSYDALGEGLKKAYVILRDKLKNAVPVSADNMLVMARAYRGLGDYRNALERYNDLLRGVGPQFPQLYWQIQIERCWTILEGYPTNEKVMGQLEIQLKQLRLEDPALGGRLGDFNAIQRALDEHKKK